MIYGNRWLVEGNIRNIKDEIIKSFEKKIENEKQYATCEKIYRTVIKCIFSQPNDDYKYIVDKCKISRDYINKKFKDHCKESSEEITTYKYYDYLLNMHKFINMNETFPEIINRKGKIYAFSGNFIDDKQPRKTIIYSNKSDSFWLISTNLNKTEIKEYKNITDITGFASKKYHKKYIVPNYLQDDYLKIVDAEQGYYLLSEPPAGVKRKALK